MSKSNYLLLLIMAIGLSSCNDTFLSTDEVSSKPPIEEEVDGIYPYSQHCTTRGISVPNWESWEKVRLSSGVIEIDSVAVPWSENELVPTTIPTQIRKDIKRENGWMLVKYTVNGNWGRNNNYMFFYNKFTGILKVFYYLDNTVGSSTGIWQLKIDVPQKLFAFIGDTADPINGIYNRQELHCTNITSTDTSGFTYGWNCFQVELAYDPQFSSGTLIINPVNRTSSEITLTGAYGSSSKGTFITTTDGNTSSGDITGSAIAAGEDAYNFIMKELSNNKINISDSTSGNNTANETLSDIIRKGTNKLFSSFTARYNNNKNDKYNLQFTTNGIVGIGGNITTETTGGLTPGSLNLSKASLGVSLGVWNLEKQPTIYFDPTAKLLTWGENQLPIYHLWRMNGNSMDKISFSYKCIINPDIIQYLNSYNCLATPFVFYKDSLPADFAKYPHGSIAKENQISIIGANREKVYENYYIVTDFYKKFKVYFPDRKDQYTSLPRILFLPKGTIDGVHGSIGVKYDILVKITTTLRVNNDVNDTISITKTFAPQLEWDPKLYNQNENFYEDPYKILIGYVL